MSILAVVLGAPLALLVLVLRSIATDEVRALIERHIADRVEASIAALPPELRDEWADEWRAELASMRSTPVRAAKFARGLRQSAVELTANSAHTGSARNAVAGYPSSADPLCLARGYATASAVLAGFCFTAVVLIASLSPDGAHRRVVGALLMAFFGLLVASVVSAYQSARAR